MYGSDRHVCLRAVSELGAAAVATASCSSFPNGLLRISPSQNLVYAIDTALGTREYNARDLGNYPRRKFVGGLLYLLLSSWMVCMKAWQCGFYRSFMIGSESYARIKLVPKKT